MEQAAATGMPLVRHPWLATGAIEDAQRDPQTFLLGPDLFVAPVVVQGAKRVRVMLPDGMWVHAWSGRVSPGGRTVSQAAPIGQPAAWARAGSLPAELIRGCKVFHGEHDGTEARPMR